MSGDLRMFMEDECVVIDAPGHQTEAVNGDIVVTYPPPAHVFGNDPSFWNTGARIRVTIPKDMVINTSSPMVQLQKDILEAVRVWFFSLDPNKDQVLRHAYGTYESGENQEQAKDSLPHVLASVYDGKGWHPCDPSAVAPPDSPEGVSAIRIFKEDGKVVVELPGSITVDEEGREVVTFPPDPKIYGTDRDGWNTSERIRASFDEPMVAALQDMVGDRPTMDLFELSPDRVVFGSSHEGAQLLATHFFDVLDSSSAAVNYIDFRFMHPEKGLIVVTTFRPGGKTPHELRLEAEKDRDAAQSEVKYTRKRVNELCGQLDAVDKELLGTPVVDVKDRKHPQWSLGLAPARRLREERDDLKRQNAELQHQLQWWIDTSNYNASRANLAEGALDLVRKVNQDFAAEAESIESMIQTCSAKDLGVLESRLCDIREVQKDLAGPLAAAEPEDEPKRGDPDVRVRGDWMQTFSGGVFWPLEPKAEDIRIEDIAHALANTCRFSGHVREFYSVAQHCVLASTIVPPEDAKWALLHDAAEAYVSDLVRPIKHSPGGRWFRRIEASIMRCVCERFGLPICQPKSVDEADLVMLGTERRDLMAPPPRPWKWVGEPMATTITTWTPSYAELAFLNRAQELGIE